MYDIIKLLANGFDMVFLFVINDIGFMYDQVLLKKGGNIVSLELMKKYLRVDTVDDDEIISNCIDFAESYAEKKSSVVLSQKDYRIITDEMNRGVILIELRPVLSVLKILVDGIELDSEKYKITNTGEIEILTAKRRVFEVFATFGYESLDNVPVNIKHAIITHVIHLYENRSGQLDEAPKMTNQIYNEIKRIRL